jgi:hypothetical protein
LGGQLAVTFLFFSPFSSFGMKTAASSPGGVSRHFDSL